ncbi:hypothetical protein J6S35_03170 [Candidatus Saccharibacteria bacterium]|nr:hypothetical protein [Candidatus Saccharibacteria bacterium]
MKQMTELANFFAKNSIIADKDCITRGLCRKAYQAMPTCWMTISPKYMEIQRRVKQGHVMDSYPWPYSDPEFAIWSEGNSQVLDHLGFPVKDCTSYCAWKIEETTSRLISKPSDLPDCSPKYWQTLLRRNGFYRVLKRPEAGYPHIGIPSPNRHIINEVVWFEGFYAGFDGIEREEDNGGNIIFSTYKNKKFFHGLTMPDSFIWVQVGRHMTYPEI